jgi:RNA polymerase sigma factor (TIGR02999 family)
MTDRDDRRNPEPGGDVTGMLEAWSGGDGAALGRMMPIVYDELKAIAQQVFRRERGDHTLQPTAVVHEALLKLARGRPLSYRDRAHFFAVASQAMRQVLVDYARARISAKRGGGATRVELGEPVDPAMGGALAVVDVLAVHEALNRLAARDAGQARVVELRFFGGLSVDEIALVLEVSEATVKRTWRLARAFLSRDLGAQTGAGAGSD